MIPDQTGLKDEVEGDVAKVLKALEAGIVTAGDNAYASALRSMRAPIEAWAKRGRDAAATRDKAPGANGWSGWAKAGTTYLDGIEDLAQTGKHEKIDAITQAVLEAPSTTATAVEHVAAKAHKKIVAAADDALHAVGGVVSGVSSGINSILVRAALAAVAVAVLLVVVKKAA